MAPALRTTDDSAATASAAATPAHRRPDDHAAGGRCGISAARPEPPDRDRACSRSGRLRLRCRAAEPPLRPDSAGHHHRTPARGRRRPGTRDGGWNALRPPRLSDVDSRPLVDVVRPRHRRRDGHRPGSRAGRSSSPAVRPACLPRAGRRRRPRIVRRRERRGRWLGWWPERGLDVPSRAGDGRRRIPRIGRDRQPVGGPRLPDRTTRLSAPSERLTDPLCACAQGA